MAKLYTVLKRDEHNVRYWSEKRGDWRNVFERDLFTADEVIRLGLLRHVAEHAAVVKEVNAKDAHYVHAYTAPDLVRVRHPYAFLEMGGEFRRHRKMSLAYQWFKENTSCLRQVEQSEEALVYLGHYVDQRSDDPDQRFTLTASGKYTSTKM